MANDIVPLEQQRYATLLKWGANSGLALLVLAFGAYVLGVVTPHVPLDQLPNLWNLPVAEYLQKTNSPKGWDWLALVGKGDYASLLGIAWLSSCSLLCLVSIMPIYASRKDRAFVLICVAALLVQVVAASGILGAGHH